jgi:hypothetical protein
MNIGHRMLQKSFAKSEFKNAPGVLGLTSAPFLKSAAEVGDFWDSRSGRSRFCESIWTVCRHLVKVAADR